MLYKGLTLITVLSFLSNAVATPFHECDAGPQPISVDVEGCDVEPCLFVDGTDVIAIIKFKNPSDSITLIPKATITLGWFNLDFPLPEQTRDGCKLLLNGKKCPLTKGEEISVRLVMPIKKLPHVAVNLKLSMIGDNEEVLNCFQGGIKVVGA